MKINVDESLCTSMKQQGIVLLETGMYKDEEDDETGTHKDEADDNFPFL